VITPSDEGALRYRVPDGRSGRLYPDGDRRFHGGAGWASREPRIAEAVFDGCPGNRIEFRLKDGPSGVAQRVAVTRTPTTFSSLGNTLYGELFAPEKPQALVVLVFGSGQDSAVAYNYVQHLLAYHGIAAFVYDKRGTGKSTGRFTVDFSELADDALMAMAHARKLLNAPGAPVGLMGESQGGWIAPLAAVRAPADFVIVSYGLAISPLDEDRFEVMNELRAKGYDDGVVAKGRELTDITARIMLSRFTDGLDDLRKFKAAHADAKWLQEVEGDFTGPLLRSPDDQFEELRQLLGFDAILDYDAQAALRRVQVPMLWIVAGKDTEAPSAPTLEFLRTLQAAPAQLDIAVFPNADHGILEDDRQSAGYHDLLVKWIRTRKLEGQFGTAVLQPDRR
jgi:alpha-beta hydrolase superfamily lysophospholipase